MATDSQDDNFVNYDREVEKSSCFHLSRADNDLFDEESNKPYLLISVKRISLPKDGEDWHILENDKFVLQFKGTRFTKAEKKFLRGPEGMKFLISAYKDGCRSALKIKQRIKQDAKV